MTTNLGKALRDKIPPVEFVTCPGCGERTTKNSMVNGRCRTCIDRHKIRKEETVRAARARQNLNHALEDRELEKQIKEVWE